MPAGMAESWNFVFRGIDVSLFSLDGGLSLEVHLSYRGQFLSATHYAGISVKEGEIKARVKVLEIENAWRTHLRLAIRSIEK